MSQSHEQETGLYDRRTDKHVAWPPNSAYSEQVCAWLNAAIDSGIEIYFNDGAYVYKVVRVNPFGAIQLQIVILHEGRVTSLTCMYDHPFSILLASDLKTWQREVTSSGKPK